MSEIDSPFRPNSRIYFNNKEQIKKDQQQRKRNILYLILKYLSDQKYYDTIETLQNEAQIHTQQYQICDNIDLEIILQEYQSYYFMKYQKYPTILRKATSDEITTTKRESSANIQKTKKRNENVLKTTQTSQETQNNFQIDITPLTTIQNELKIEQNDIIEHHKLSMINLENYSNENREIVKEILKQILPKTPDKNKWNDCIGHEQIIETLKEGLIYPNIYPQLFKNIEPWNCVLLYGPPGTGKTLLAKILACQIKDRTFFNITSSMIISKWRGESEKILKILFDLANILKPSIIFIDEIDALCSINNNHEASRRFKSELLTQIDGILNKNQEIFILATTNTPWDIDSALLRRFDQRLFVPLPNHDEKNKIFRYFLKDIIGTNREIFDNLKLNQYLSGSDIKIICKDINMMQIRQQIQGNQIKKISISDINLAVNKIKPCVEKEMYQKYLDWNNKFGSI